MGKGELDFATFAACTGSTGSDGEFSDVDDDGSNSDSAWSVIQPRNLPHNALHTSAVGFVVLCRRFVYCAGDVQVHNGQHTGAHRAAYAGANHNIEKGTVQKATTHHKVCHHHNGFCPPLPSNRACSTHSMAHNLCFPSPITSTTAQLMRTQEAARKLLLRNDPSLRPGGAAGKLLHAQQLVLQLQHDKQRLELRLAAYVVNADCIRIAGGGFPHTIARHHHLKVQAAIERHGCVCQAAAAWWGGAAAAAVHHCR